MSTAATPGKMSTKTKIIIGVIILAIGAAVYYFMVYKPKKDKEAGATKKADTYVDPNGTSPEQAVYAGTDETGSRLIPKSRPKVGDTNWGYWKNGQWYWNR